MTHVTLRAFGQVPVMLRTRPRRADFHGTAVISSAAALMSFANATDPLMLHFAKAPHHAVGQAVVASQPGTGSARHRRDNQRSLPTVSHRRCRGARDRLRPRSTSCRCSCR